MGGTAGVCAFSENDENTSELQIKAFRSFMAVTPGCLEYSKIELCFSLVKILVDARTPRGRKPLRQFLEGLTRKYTHCRRALDRLRAE